MKANKVKTSGKVVKKQTKRIIKKELELTISEKFFEAMKSLGHDAEKFSKEIKKTSKALAKKLAGTYKDVKNAVEDKFEGKSKSIKPKSISRAGVSAGKSVVSAVKKAEKVVARVSKAAVKTKVPRLVTAGTGSSRSASSKPRVRTQTVAGKVVAHKPAASVEATTKAKVTVSRSRKPASKVAPSSTASAKPEGSATPTSIEKL
ncbi:MAG: hypothetical protein Q8S11_16220 [Daejeonella sp.]|uniref:hypothetical protein n=1 Tax=Daejeonella sp. TaxID=2805397 RepID=UPI002732C9D3|nr:hypothetical protein [Daejeonella sp.]MDP3469889.1 hypothetical protein [Daejeonella sp.]